MLTTGHSSVRVASSHQPVASQLVTGYWKLLLPATHRSHRPLRGFLWVDVGVNARRLEDAPPLFLIGAGETHHDADRRPRVHDAARDIITAGDAAKDVDEQPADAGLTDHDLDGLLHILRRRAAADVEEVGR